MSGADLGVDRHREVQQLAYRCAETVAATLEPGTTEKTAAMAMRRWLLDHGADDFFHLPFAWFGERTAFRRFRSKVSFFPSNRRLEEGMPYILDCAPIVDGYMADIGYAGCLGGNAAFDEVMAGLAEHRANILEGVRQRRTFADIYRAVDARLAAQGLENRHREYPGRVLAHKVWHLNVPLPRVYVARFGIRALSRLGAELVTERRHRRSPLWAGGKASDHPPTPGLWAVEPHIARGDVGAKFEEILVVTDDDAYWLDDDLPHVRRWTAA